MKVLVLSCDTGGGHNACGRYIQEELISNNIKCDFKNYFKIVHLSKRDFSNKIFGDFFGKHSELFNYMYKMGDAYDKTNIVSPVYLVNKFYSNRLYKFILKNNYDLVICPHLFPALAMSAINKKHKFNFIFVDTDYEYHPFTDEVLADYYVIPKDLENRFVARGVDREKLLPLGIPIASNYINNAKSIKDKLRIDKKLVLVLLGSTGFGNIEDILSDLLAISDIHIVIVCGKNKKLYNSLRRYGNNNLTVFGYSKNINDLIKSSDIVISKPGGLSSTEVAVFRKPFIHAFPIPGVETSNTEFFDSHNLSLVAHSNDDIIKYLNLLLKDDSICNKIVDNQKKYIPVNSAKDLVNFIKDKYQ